MPSKAKFADVCCQNHNHGEFARAPKLVFSNRTFKSYQNPPHHFKCNWTLKMQGSTLWHLHNTCNLLFQSYQSKILVFFAAWYQHEPDGDWSTNFNDKKVTHLKIDGKVPAEIDQHLPNLTHLWIIGKSSEDRPKLEQ